MKRLDMKVLAVKVDRAEGIRKRDLDEEDQDVEGTYAVSYKFSGNPSVDAGRALDVFHQNVAIAVLDHFDIGVFACDPMFAAARTQEQLAEWRVSEPEDYESYGYKGSGDAEKVA